MSKLGKLPAPDLNILRKLVAQLEASLEASEQIKKANDSDIADFVVEMSKASGLLAGLMQESTMLIGDISTIVRVSQQPTQPQKTPDFLDKILGGIKGSGGSIN